MINETKVSELEGLIVDHIDDVGGDQLMITTSCGRRFVFQHYQDCCESVKIYDTKGDLKSLEGHTLISVDMEAYHEDPDDVNIEDNWRDSWTWTDITFRTTHATVISRWLGESNGYYGEDVSLDELID
jgi:hypothetical protein